MVLWRFVNGYKFSFSIIPSHNVISFSLARKQNMSVEIICVGVACVCPIIIYVFNVFNHFQSMCLTINFVSPRMFFILLFAVSLYHFNLLYFYSFPCNLMKSTFYNNNIQFKFIRFPSHMACACSAIF